MHRNLMISPSHAPYLRLELLQRRIAGVLRRPVQRRIATSGNARNHAPRYPFDAEDRSTDGRATQQRLSQEGPQLHGTRRVARARLLKTGPRFLNGTGRHCSRDCPAVDGDAQAAAEAPH